VGKYPGGSFSMNARCLFLVLGLWGVPVFAGAPPVPAPIYIDDEQHFQALETAILKLAHDGKATRGKELVGQLKRKQCQVPPAPPSAPVLQPEEIYTGCSGGVVAITSAWKNNGVWQAGDPATAWVLSPDGVLVTNHHVFADPEKDEVFGILTRDAHFYPVTEILAADGVNDIAIFKVPAKGLQPLALSQAEPVGKKVCVISHPDSQFYTFTQGNITRYTLQRDDPKNPLVKYMSISAEFARGSSGGPVLNEHGAVVGMVCSTKTIYYGEKGKDKDDDVQMVMKFCIPADSIRELLKSAAKETAEVPKSPAEPSPSAPEAVPPPKAAAVPEPR
jgi:serine protease Do